MADGALSISASPLAALLTATTAGEPAGSAATQSPDPFAALLAMAVAPKAAIDIATAQSADPAAALLATAAVPTTNVAVVTAPTADPIATLLATAAVPTTNVAVVNAPAPDPIATLLATPNASAPTTNLAAATAPAADPPAALPAPQPASPAALPVTKAAGVATVTVPTSARIADPFPVTAGAIAPVETDAASAVTRDDTADDEKSAAKDEDKDPLADAIASGATAVLALAPAIVTPVPAQASTPVPTPTEAPGVETSARKIGNIASGVQGAPRFETPVHSASSGSATTALPGDTVRTPTRDREGSGSPQSQPAPAPVSETNATTAPLSPEAVKAVIAALQSDETGAQTIPATSTTIAAKVEGEQPQQPAVQAAQQPASPAPMQPRRRGDELTAPRRAGDTRRRAETASADIQPVGIAQRATETARAPAEVSAPVAAKGDLLVQQTLTIAKDGAWLDRLAHDIASSAGNGGNLHFKLEPQNLGALSVAISQSADGASIRMTADNDTTRNILLDAQPKLVAEARAHGLRVSDTQVDLNQNHSQNQGANQDASRSPHGNSGQNSTAQNGQNRQSSPDHQPFVSNLVRKAEAESESPERDTDALYA